MSSIVEVRKSQNHDGRHRKKKQKRNQNKVDDAFIHRSKKNQTVEPAIIKKDLFNKVDPGPNPSPIKVIIRHAQNRKEDVAKMSRGL
jgi:hypothetical protein